MLCLIVFEEALFSGSPAQAGLLSLGNLEAHPAFFR